MNFPAAHTSPPTTSLLWHEQEDADSTMSPSLRFVLGESKQQKVSEKHPTSKKKRHTKRRKDIDLNSLSELDEAVASVGKPYTATRGTEEDDVASITSQSIATQDGHSIYTQRHLIDNMHDVTERLWASGFGGSQSARSYQSQSKSLKTSKRRRKRAGLEEMISETIVGLAANDDADSHFLDMSLERVPSRESTTNYILQDLVQTSAIIENEVSSLAIEHHPVVKPVEEDLSKRRNRYATFSLLPPIASESYTSMDEDELFLVKHIKSSVKEDSMNQDPTIGQDREMSSGPYANAQDLDFLTPETSTRRLDNAFFSFDNTFDQAERQEIQDYIITGKASDERDAALPVEEPFHSEDASLHTEFVEDKSWLAFSANPFGDNDSTESPDSIAYFNHISDFTHVRSWKTRETGWKTPTRAII